MLRQLGRVLDRLALDEITKDVALEWRTVRRQEVGPATINREQEILVHMLGTSVPKHLETNPLRGLSCLPVRKLEVRILTQKEEARPLERLDQEGRTLVVCAHDTLARLSDVVNLDRAPDHGTHLSFLGPKVEAYKVPVSTRLRAALDNLPDRGPRYFPRRHTSTVGLRAAQRSVIRMFRAACADADIPLGRKDGGVSFHVLRHTGASRMLEAGVDVKTVMEIGGSKNLKVMERYLHPSDATKRNAVDLIGRPTPSPPAVAVEASTAAPSAEPAHRNRPRPGSPAQRAESFTQERRERRKRSKSPIKRH